MGDWNENDISSPMQTKKWQASSSPGQAISDNSLLSSGVPVIANDPNRHALADRQVVNIVPDSKAASEITALKEQLAEQPVIRKKLTTALQGIVYP